METAMSKSFKALGLAAAALALAHLPAFAQTKVTNDGISPSEIVIVGDITSAWYMFGPIVEAELKQNALSKEPRLRPSFEGNTARLRSAVALVMNGSLV